jgi:4-azaleucine resistance transporter AzlC
MTRDVIKSTFPVLFGYIPLGIAFGMLFQDLGYPWYLATLMAFFVYAGTAQFMIVGLLAAGVGLTEIAISTFLINSRHIFYGLSMLNSYGDWGLRKVYLAFGLTDETYSLVTTINPKDATKKEQQYFLITALNHSYWVISCTIGAVIGSSFSINTQGMEFTLTALFVVLVIEQLKKIKKLLPFMIAIFSSIIALYLFSEQMLLGSIALSVTLLIVNNLLRNRHE